MTELNNSGRKPFGYRVIVKMKSIGKKNENGDHTEGGLIIPHDAWERRQMNVVVGQIVDMGAKAFYEHEDAPKTGDYVIVKRYAGVHIEGVDGNAYRNCLDVDIHTITINGDDVEVI